MFVERHPAPIFAPNPVCYYFFPSIYIQRLGPGVQKGLALGVCLPVPPTPTPWEWAGVRTGSPNEERAWGLTLHF